MPEACTARKVVSETARLPSRPQETVATMRIAASAHTVIRVTASRDGVLEPVWAFSTVRLKTADENARPRQGGTSAIRGSAASPVSSIIIRHLPTHHMPGVEPCGSPITGE